jgi:hypothetical protein
VQSSSPNAAKERLAALEKALVAAKAKPMDRAATDHHHKEKKLAVDRINEDLHWAKRRLEMTESAMRSRELRNAQLAEPEISQLFEITCDDGRKSRQTAPRRDDAAKIFEQRLSRHGAN